MDSITAGNAEASQGVGSFTRPVTDEFQTMLAGNPEIPSNFAPPPRGIPSQVFGMPSQPYGMPPYGMPPYGMHREWKQVLYGMPPNAYNPHAVIRKYLQILHLRRVECPHRFLACHRSRIACHHMACMENDNKHYMACRLMLTIHSRIRYSSFGFSFNGWC